MDGADPRRLAGGLDAREEVEPTEDGVAREFADRNVSELRYCHHTGCWFVWDSTRWRQNETQLAFDCARRLARQASRDATPHVRAGMRRASFALAVERFAKADQRLAVTSEAWDADPMLLGTPGGVLDLKSGELRVASRADYITKQTAVAPAEKSDCPLWLSFLHDATGGDVEVVDFLRRWAGYCLTGSTREHAMMFIYGPGGNGKSVFLNTVAGLLGDYARTAPMDSFTEARGDRHPTDLAMLRGARLVSATETEQGRAWTPRKTPGPDAG